MKIQIAIKQITSQNQMPYCCNNAWNDSLCLSPMFLILYFKDYAQYSNTEN